MNRPARAVFDQEIAHAHARAILKADRTGTRGVQRFSAESRPPLSSLSFQCAQTGQRNIFFVFRVNERTMTRLLIALPADMQDGVCVKIVRKAQNRAGLQMQLDIAP